MLQGGEILLSFTEWFEVTYKEKWQEDYVLLVGLEAMNGYEQYCKTNDYEPIWNG